MVDNFCSIILAAGKGTRMKSNKPKVLHEICNRAMLWHIIEAVDRVSKEQIVVIGYEGEKVKSFLQKEYGKGVIKTAFQEEQLGTGHAVMKTEEFISDDIDNVLVVMGDTPLILPEELNDLILHHNSKDNTCTVLTAEVSNPEGYGRIYRNKNNEIEAIIEENEASNEFKEINEINTGIYCFKKKELFSVLHRLDPSDNLGEYYLTDLIEFFKLAKAKVGSKKIDDIDSVLGVNDRQGLVKAQHLLQKRINYSHMEKGVTIMDPNNTLIDPRVEIGKDTIIYPGCYIEQGSSIGDECVLGPDTRINNSTLGNGVEVARSTVLESVLKEEVKIGPYAYIRPGCNLMARVKIGDFVEVKNSFVGEDSKASHLSYIGDAVIGKGVNIGAGTVIVNYDGKEKFETIIEDNAFIGCNCSLIAPLMIQKRAFVAAGSTITQNVEEGSLAIARKQQVNKEGWRDKQLGN